MIVTQPWTRFWGKAHPLDASGPAWHPVAAHALDVAAVALLVPRPTALPLPRQTIGFLVSLHDIGKFSSSFQALRPDLWPDAVLGPLAVGGRTPIRHDAAGFALLSTTTPDLTDPVLPDWPAMDADHVWQALAGHHGRPVDVDPSRIRADVLPPACKQAARDFVSAMLDLFRPAPLSLPRRLRGSLANPARLGWDLAGLTTLADWVGSRQQWFAYVAADKVSDPAAYFWDHALPCAAAALSAAGLGAVAPSRHTGVQVLFPAIAAPSAVQNWAQEVTLPDGPVLAVIEDATGSGKTEAAITLAHRLLAAGRVGGVFVALPTMATANAMFERMVDAYRGLFAPESRPSLILAHGRAGLDPRFTGIIEGGPSPEHEAADPADLPAEAHCAAWLADDRRRALLASFGVGTIDQALLAVLPVRHAALRQQGLKGKVLIVDEAHAFDAYMQRELVELLRFHAAMGGSAILLSATLPLALRRELIEAFRAGLATAVPAAVAATAYPLTTLASAAAVVEEPHDMRDGLARSVTVTRLPDASVAMARIAMAAKAGAAVAWVRNTVDDAIAGADALRTVGLNLILFHARFAMCDRLKIEAEVLRRFGRTSQGKARQAVLVATQVIEQSLDLDFDLLCTDLAPADLLIQRAGRLWRHRRADRPVPGPELLVISPAPVADPPADWIRASQPGTAAIYRDPALLWRGARRLFATGSIATPGDLRPLVEAAADDEVPDALSPQVQKAFATGRANEQLARQNTLSLDAGYHRGNGAWEPDVITPTRLEERPQVTLRLALERDGTVAPYATDDFPRRAWALSEVTTSRRRIATCSVPARLATAAESARAGWGRWERDSPRVLLAVLTPDGESYTLEARTEAGEPVVVRYEPRLGLLMGAGPAG